MNVIGGSCCCEPGCEIASDDFERSDNSDINEDAPVVWSGDVGDFALSSGAIYTLTPARLKCDDTNTDPNGSGVVRATVFGSDPGDELEIWLGESALDCIVARLTLGNPAGTLEIIERSGSDTVLASIDLDVTYAAVWDLALYYDAETGRVTADVPSVDRVCASATFAATHGGVAVESVTSAAGFSQFSLKKLSDGCGIRPACTEPVCAFFPSCSGASEWEAEVEIVGLQNDLCANCTDLFGGVFLPPYVQCITTTSFLSIDWMLVQSNPSCFPSATWVLGATITCATNGVVTLSVRISVATGLTVHYTARWRLDMDEEDFLTDTKYEIPFQDGDTANLCDASNASVFLSIFQP